MRIVILDGYTINPGDLSWEGLSQFGEYITYDRTSPAELLTRAREAVALLTNKVPIPKAAIKSLPSLRYIGVMATGYNVVDLEAAGAHKIIVTNVPAYSTPSTAQGTFALLLELTNHVGHYSNTVREGRWSANADFSYVDSANPITELSGLTFGIIGFGNIGQAVARIARAFGMKVLVHTRTERDPTESPGMEFCSLDRVLRESDVVSLHCQLTPATRGIINADSLALMKPSSMILNPGRGPLVDEVALAAALNAKSIAGAGLDVLSVEPPTERNPLLTARNCLITPHNAWASRATRRRLIAATVENLRGFATGHLVNVVSQ